MVIAGFAVHVKSNDDATRRTHAIVGWRGTVFQEPMLSFVSQEYGQKKFN